MTVLIWNNAEELKTMMEELNLENQKIRKINELDKDKIDVLPLHKKRSKCKSIVA